MAVDYERGSVTRLILSGGTYHVSSITLGSDARLECSADCEVRVNGRVAVGARSFIGAVGTGLTPGNFRLVVKGANGTTGPNGLPAALGLDSDARMDAFVLAPNGTMRFGQRVAAKGKTVAKDVFYGSDSTHVSIDFPVITQHPAAQTVIPGQSTTFTVAATGTGIVYQWQRNGTNIAGATSASYSFNATSGDNNAQYRAVVTNAAGSVTSNAAVLAVVACAAVDSDCDGIDDDCNGAADEDFVLTCLSAPANGYQMCGANGTLTTVTCGDGNACNGVEACSAGACQNGTPPTLDDGNACTADSCNPAFGVVHTPVATGTSCTDGNACNGGETCNAAGSCAAGTAPALDDGNPCTADSCSPATGVAHTPVAAGVSCTDGNACNGAEVCSGAGACLAGSSPSVDDGNPCTADSCDPALGVVHASVAWVRAVRTATRATERRRAMAAALASLAAVLA